MNAVTMISCRIHAGEMAVLMKHFKVNEGINRNEISSKLVWLRVYLKINTGALKAEAPSYLSASK